MKGIGIKGIGVVSPVMAGGVGGTPPWDFNPALITFTPGMAKRATSVFAAAPIVQGKRDGTGVSDSLTFPQGNAIISPAFYSNSDNNQGSITFRFTPEWDTTDTVTRYLFDIGGNNGVKLFRIGGGNMFLCYIGGQQFFPSMAGIVAGTAYNICIRWDGRNTLDGTNYACFSVNDVHTFGITTTPTMAAADVNNKIGFTGSYPVNAIIEGFTIYRRVLYDGTYGVNVGNGDEVALIAAGVDPTTVTGSWDVCFCLPTNATAGALVTGTGEAWSHPHSSNLLTRGFLSDKYYGGSQWGVKFNGTSTYIDCGSGATLDDLCAGGAVMQVEGWFRHAGSLTSALICKGGVSTATGWSLRVDDTGLPVILIDLANTNATATHTVSVEDGKYHHIVGHYNDTTKVAQIAIDGVWGAAGGVGDGAYVSDAAINLRIGRASAGTDYYFTGSIGWINIHNDAHYTPGTNFLPPRAAPAADVEEWLLNEGTGVTATAQVTSPANDGTITAGTWEQQWHDEGTPVRLRSVVGSATYRAVLTSAAEISDLADNAFTADGWIRITKSATLRYLCYKGLPGTNGWNFNVTTGGLLSGVVECANTDATSVGTARIDDGYWHYVKMTFDDAGDRKIDLFVDNVEVAYTTETAGNGAIVSDAGVDGAIGHAVTGLLGAHGWIRWSNVVRGAGMIPRSNPPDPADANTIGQWNADEGYGAVLTDLSGEGNNGAMAGTYSWNNSPAMESDSPGARNYAWGYVFGGDAANEGTKQYYTVAAGNDYTFIAGGYSEDGVAQPKIVIRDETAGVDLRTILGTTTSTERVPDRFHTCFEAPVGCTSISIKLLNATATGVVGWQQCMLKSDLWDDAGFEVGTAPTDVGTPTTSAQSAVQAHTGANSWLVVTDADNEGIMRTINVTSGKYYTVRAWMYVATAGKTGKIQFTNGLLQHSTAVNSINDTTIGSWKVFSCVVRATAATMNVNFLANSGTTFYVDDVSFFANDDVSLTVTPASAANSVESGGIRVDGWDLSPVAIPTGRLFPSFGWVRIRYLPGHNGADALKFGSATPYIADYYGDANNYFYVYWSAANTMTLAFNSAGGGLQTGNWATAGAILAGGNYLVEIRYDAASMKLYVDGTLRITVTSPIAFSTIPVFCYPGTANTVVAGQHEDSVFISP